MNLMSEEDIEDNIMRVVSKRIAAELFEMTFRKGNSYRTMCLRCCKYMQNPRAALCIVSFNRHLHIAQAFLFEGLSDFYSCRNGENIFEVDNNSFVTTYRFREFTVK